MSADERLDSLRAKHACLEALIEEEKHRPHPDDLRLSELKREKLRIKDEIFLRGG
ncbi:MAG: YdcH family protein [Kiloniellaceae bacterium]